MMTCPRGKPTCHKKFGEATAILAGDALLTLAFETLFYAPNRMVASRGHSLRMWPHRPARWNGMVGGQVADLEAEGQRLQPAELEYIHRLKTAALDLRVGRRRVGCVAARMTTSRAPAQCFGETIGWAFQVVDDILDVEESSAALGKMVGKDAAQQKATMVSRSLLHSPSRANSRKSWELARMAEIEPIRRARGAGRQSSRN